MIEKVKMWLRHGLTCRVGGLRGIRNDPGGGERDAGIVFLTPVPTVDVGLTSQLSGGVGPVSLIKLTTELFPF